MKSEEARINSTGNGRGRGEEAMTGGRPSARAEARYAGWTMREKRTKEKMKRTKNKIELEIEEKRMKMGEKRGRREEESRG